MGCRLELGDPSLEQILQSDQQNFFDFSVKVSDPAIEVGAVVELEIINDILNFLQPVGELVNLRLHPEVFADLDNSELLSLDQVDLVFELNNAHGQFACVLLDRVFVPPNVFEAGFEGIESFVLLLGNQLLEFVLDGSIGDLEGTNALL
jgi:hypothetical protein